MIPDCGSAHAVATLPDLHISYNNYNAMSQKNHSSFAGMKKVRTPPDSFTSPAVRSRLGLTLTDVDIGNHTVTFTYTFAHVSGQPDRTSHTRNGGSADMVAREELLKASYRDFRPMKLLIVMLGLLDRVRLRYPEVRPCRRRFDGIAHDLQLQRPDLCC